LAGLGTSAKASHYLVDQAHEGCAQSAAYKGSFIRRQASGRRDHRLPQAPDDVHLASSWRPPYSRLQRQVSGLPHLCAGPRVHVPWYALPDYHLPHYCLGDILRHGDSNVARHVNPGSSGAVKLAPKTTMRRSPSLHLLGMQAGHVGGERHAAGTLDI